DDLAGPLSLHDRGYGVTEEKGRVQVEGDQALPLGQRQVVYGGRGAGDDGAAAVRVDEDVDTAVGAHHAVDHLGHLSRIEPIGPAPLGLSPATANAVHDRVETGLVRIYADHRASFAADDLRRRATDPAAGRCDEHDLFTKADGPARPQIGIA